jgi:methylenetetrahydrofolate reductase (NADPH)
MKFKDTLKQNDFVVTAQVNLAEAPDADALLRQGEILRPVVDAVQIADESSTRMQMAGLAAAALLIPQGIDPILHMICRDRNRIAMVKDLIGASALGVTSVLVKRGSKFEKDNDSGVQNVFDLGAIEFMTYIRRMAESDEYRLAADFLTGASAKVFEPAPGWEPKSLLLKCESGAGFVQNSLCFDMEVVRSYMKSVVASKLTHKLRFIMAVSPLPSAEVARWIRDNVEGSRIPESIIDRLERAPDPESEGVEICAELLRELASIPGVSGVNLSTLGRLETIPASIEASGMRPPPLS